jgi:hypothetical protein
MPPNSADGRGSPRGRKSSSKHRRGSSRGGIAAGRQGQKPPPSDSMGLAIAASAHCACSVVKRTSDLGPYGR